jgi:multidrug resistance efflux pump
MIAFLTLCYVAVLAALVWFRVIKLTLWWKLSPVLFVLICFFVLIFPMQWGAPSGTVNVYRAVVEVVPNVAGQVVEVSAKPLTPIKQGDVLFKIDPGPYQAEVSRLKAALKEAEQAAKMLPTDLAAAKASVAQSQAALVEAKQNAESLGLSVVASNATLTKCEAQLALTQADFDRTQGLISQGASTQEQLQTRQRNLEAAKATVDEARAQRDQAQLAFNSQIGGVNTAVIHAEETLRGAQAAEAKAQLAVESIIDGENTTVAQLRAQLATATLNLDWTSVRAPSDGYAVGLSLRRGQRVVNLPVRAWLTYVETSGNRLAVGIHQNSLRHVQPGQPAEVIFKLYPGRTFSAKVESIAHITPEGQLQASGLVPVAPNRQTQRLPYGVILALDDESIDATELPGGAIGSAAIYTDNAKLTHIIRRVELRIQSWLNYILP